MFISKYEFNKLEKRLFELERKVENGINITIIPDAYVPTITGILKTGMSGTSGNCHKSVPIKFIIDLLLDHLRLFIKYELPEHQEKISLIKRHPDDE